MNADANEWSDHDPEAGMTPEAESSLLAAIRSTPWEHPDADALRDFSSRD